MKLPLLPTRDAIQRLLEACQNNLSLSENLRVKVLSVTSPATADTMFHVKHSLGTTPVAWFACPEESPAVVYATRRSEWNAEDMYLKCNLPTVKFTLVVW